MKNIDKAIKETMKIEFNYVDLFYAFCAAKGIEDPECDVETDEEYEALEREFESKISYRDLKDLGDAIIADGMKRISRTMEEVASR